LASLPYQRHQKQRQRNQKQKQESSFNFAELNGKPFWIWAKEDHRQQAAATNGQCCFNHVVGLPQKNNKEYPLFDYEKLLYDSLMSVDVTFEDKHLWVKKATGLGVTEFMLRIMAWLCTRDETFDGSQLCIVTGPNIEIFLNEPFLSINWI
jgi:hypothetical protein